MSLQHIGYIELPPNAGKGGFDHAAVHRSSGRLYVAHTINDAIDVIDCRKDTYLHSIGGLKGVAGALVSEERNMVFTSNRGENTVGVFHGDNEAGLFKIAVGIGPNGLAYDPGRNLLLAANVGNATIPGSFTVSMVDIASKAMAVSIPVPGRTRWTIFDQAAGAFFVNIADPARIVVIEAANPSRMATTFAIPAAGPHGLDLDIAGRRLYCACDAGILVCLDSRTGDVLWDGRLSGVPDVVFFNALRERLYVAVGKPGVIDVFDTRTARCIQTVPTESGAHTLAFDAERNKVYAFLPDTHRAVVFIDKQ